MNGAVLYNGPSNHNGQPILGIVTGLDRPSANAKTGHTLQTWILYRRTDPVRASHNQRDDSVCGSCPLRRSTGGACYVELGKAPNNVWQAWRNGRYGEAEPWMFAGHVLRAGSYGDPAMLPYDVWGTILPYPKITIGYTHQWATADPRFSRFCMASVETEAQRLQAKAMGYRTFRVTTQSETLAGEIMCPHYTRGVQCVDCLLCAGTKRKAKDIAVLAHGALKGRLGD